MSEWSDGKEWKIEQNEKRHAEECEGRTKKWHCGKVGLREWDRVTLPKNRFSSLKQLTWLFSHLFMRIWTHLSIYSNVLNGAPVSGPMRMPYRVQTRAQSVFIVCSSSCCLLTDSQIIFWKHPFGNDASRGYISTRRGRSQIKSYQMVCVFEEE